MIDKFNKFKSIRKGLKGPNVIFPAFYILLSANADLCTGSHPSRNLPISSIDNLSKQAYGKKSIEDQDDKVNKVKSVRGRGTVLMLGDYPCGVFVPSGTKKVFLVKLNSKNGWMELGKEHQYTTQEGDQKSILRFFYDKFDDPRIIKVDYALFECLCQSSDALPPKDQYNTSKKDFWRKIKSDSSWRDIQFRYKKRFLNRPIFKKSGIISSTKFTMELCKEYGNTAKLSISGNVPSAALQELKKPGFLMVKDKRNLVHLVKKMLEGGAEWGAKTEVAEDYITCPAAWKDNTLKFDSSSHGYSNVEDYEAYKATYCYLNDGEYHCLVALDRIKSLIKTKTESIKSVIEQPPAIGITTTEIPAIDIPTTQTDKDEASKSKDVLGSGEVPESVEGQNNEQPNNINAEHADLNSPAGAKKVITSPMQFTDHTKPLAPPPPPPPPPVSTSTESKASQNDPGRNALLEQIREGFKLKSVGSGQQGAQNEQTTSPSSNTPLPTTTNNELGGNAGSPPSSNSCENSVNKASNPSSIPPPPPPPPPMLLTNTGLGGNGIPVPPPPPPSTPFTGASLQSNNTSQQDGVSGAKPNNIPNSNGGSMMDELKEKLSKKQVQSPDRSPDTGKTVDEQIMAQKLTTHNLSPRDEALAKIRAGVKLKSADQQRPLNEKPIQVQQTNDMASILARRIAMEMDSDSSDSSDSDDDSGNGFED